MSYPEEDWLQLAGIQHFAFCPRQWALIHLEGQWAENLRTAEGQLLHETAHDASIREKRGELLTLRDLRVHSARLGVSGACDVVEFHIDPDGIALQSREGLWQPFPVEYKRGRPKEHRADELQLCLQALCLEEMLCCKIPAGALFYHEERRRKAVELTEELRTEAETMLMQMHGYAAKGCTPKVKTGKGCGACSLQEVCLPKLCRKQSAAAYLAAAAREMKTCEN